MANQKLLEIFLDAKRILCSNDYYIYIPKKIIHVTNSENMIPHLMGMQYIGRPDMMSAYSVLYLYDVSANPELELKTDYLLVNHLEEMVLQLGMVKADNKKMQEYHCNSFMVDYKKNDGFDLHYRNLTQRYEISKIVCENKQTKRAKVIYQSREAEERELAGIKKMLTSAGIQESEKMVKAIFCLNQRFGEYHTLDMLSEPGQLKEKCRDKHDKVLVKNFFSLWSGRDKTNETANQAFIR